MKGLKRWRIPFNRSASPDCSMCIDGDALDPGGDIGLGWSGFNEYMQGYERVVWEEFSRRVQEHAVEKDALFAKMTSRTKKVAIASALQRRADSTRSREMRSTRLWRNATLSSPP